MGTARIESTAFSCQSRRSLSQASLQLLSHPDRVVPGHRRLRRTRSELRAVAGAFDHELVSSVRQAVEGTVGEDGVGEEPDPLRDVAVAREDEAGAAVALDDQRIEVLGLLLIEAVEAEVIDQEQVRGEVAAEGDFEAVVGAGLAEFAEEVVGAAEEDRVAGAGGSSAEGLCEECLADAHWPDEEGVLLALEEVQGEELVEVTAVDLDRRRPVEVLEGDALLDARREQTAFEGDVVTALHLVGHDEGEEGGVVELLGTGEGESVGQGGDRLAELEALEDGTSARRTGGGCGAGR